MNPENKKRQGVFFWLLKNLKDYSKYFKCSEKKLSKINEDFISEGPAYNCCTEFLESSGIMFDNKHWKIVMAMAPIFMKVMAEEKKRFDKTDYVLLFLEPKELIPVAGQNKREKFLLNVFGDVYPCADDNPCGCCLFYSTSKDTCSNCEIIEKEEKEQELEEWRNVNRDFFNQHKNRIPKRFHNSFLQERDPGKQAIILGNLLEIADRIEREKERRDARLYDDDVSIRMAQRRKQYTIESKAVFTEEDFPPLIRPGYTR